MLSASLIAFGHFLAIFALLSALILELLLISEAMTLSVAKRIQRADVIYGVAAMMLLGFGFLRVIYFEKSSDYYFNNGFFQAKLMLFIALGLVSIYPSIKITAWSKKLKQELAPQLSAAMVARLKKIIHWELVIILAILFCASMMSHDVGSLS